MSEQPGQGPAMGVPHDDEELHLVAGAPGPSGTGEQTTAGADLTPGPMAEDSR